MKRGEIWDLRLVEGEILGVKGMDGERKCWVSMVIRVCCED